MKNVDLLKDAFRLIQSLAAALSQTTQAIPLVTDSLAASVDRDGVVVLKGAAEMKNNAVRS